MDLTDFIRESNKIEGMMTDKTEDLSLAEIPLAGETWIVCGGRYFENRHVIFGVLDEIVQTRGMPDRVVHGGATGADSLAGQWAAQFPIEVIAEQADWAKYGKSAGPLRNQKILDEYKPDLVIAFPGGRGTADMVSRARNRLHMTLIEIKEE